MRYRRLRIDRAAILRDHCGERRRFAREADSLSIKLEARAERAEPSRSKIARRTPRRVVAGRANAARRRVGAYELVRELGRGGMGAVYLADRADGQFEKQVAIKVLKRGTDTEEVLHRFASERHILARLDHPNIARLLDAGTTDDGLPYFVMEYVAGAPVTRFVREHELSIEERISVFLKICAAVEVAHQSHVIHRDLKPSNILVNTKGEPKLLDFGIAKLVTPGQDSAERTAAGEARLTPICASPEQTDGRADFRSKRCLCARRVALRDVERAEAAQVQLGTSVSRGGSSRRSRTRPCTSQRGGLGTAGLRRLLRGGLDAIVLKALRKDPAMRYPTVAEFAADIGRHQRQEPVLALAPANSAGEGFPVCLSSGSRCCGWSGASFAGGLLLAHLESSARREQTSPLRSRRRMKHGASRGICAKASPSCPSTTSAMRTRFPISPMACRTTS